MWSHSRVSTIMPTPFAMRNQTATEIHTLPLYYQIAVCLREIHTSRFAFSPFAIRQQSSIEIHTLPLCHHTAVFHRDSHFAPLPLHSSLPYRFTLCHHTAICHTMQIHTLFLCHHTAVCHTMQIHTAVYHRFKFAFSQQAAIGIHSLSFFHQQLPATRGSHFAHVYC